MFMGIGCFSYLYLLLHQPVIRTHLDYNFFVKIVAFDLQVNTFQLVLITDGHVSFAMMNFDTLMWPVYADSTKGSPATVSLIT
jgi:Nidogen-like